MSAKCYVCGHQNHDGAFHTECAQKLAESMDNPVKTHLNWGTGQTVRFHEPFTKKEMYLQARAQEIYHHIYAGLTQDGNLEQIYKYSCNRGRGTFTDAVVEEVAKHVRWAIKIEPVEWHTGIVRWIAKSLVNEVNRRTAPRD